jgi:hypothetical protein
MTEWATPSGIAVGVSSAAALVVWIVAMLLLRRYRLGKSERPFSEEKEQYHNSAIYRDFSFFYKTTLAIITGVVLLACACKAECTNIDGSTAVVLVRLAGYLQFVSGLLFSFFIFAHQKSKIEQWDRKQPYPIWQIPLWQETWMVVATIALSATFAFGVAPYLAKVASLVSGGG